MTRLPLISVVIPVFNSVRFLAEAVGSIRAQTQADFEIIVVDDGSSDGSLELARSLPQVRCLSQANAGAAAARNVGILEASGEYLAFLDADDLWAADKIELQLPVLQSDPGIHLLAGRVEEFVTAPSVGTEGRLKRRSGDAAYTAGALLIRRSDFLKVGLFNPELRFGEFLDWHSRALFSGLQERILDRVVLRRRIHDQNTTSRPASSKASYAAAIKAHLDRKRAAARAGGAESGEEDKL